MLKNYVLGSAALVLGVSTALAMSRVDEVPSVEKLLTDKGCIVYLWSVPFEGQRPVLPFSGACTPGQPVNGKGTLTLGPNRMTGTLVNGVLHGPASAENRVTVEQDEGKSSTSMVKTAVVFDMGCIVSVGGQAGPENGACKRAMAKVAGAKPAAPATAVAPAAQPAAATSAPAAAPGKKLTEADYRKACAVHFAPAAVTQRVQEYKDMNGSEYAPPDIVEKDSREGVAKQDRETLARITAVSDADFKKAYEDKDTYYKQAASLPDGHPMLQKGAGLAMVRCLLKTRLAATPSINAAAPVAPPKPDPATALATVKGEPSPVTSATPSAKVPATPAVAVPAAKVATTPTVAAAPPAKVAAVPAVAAAPAAMPGPDHYRQVCAAEMTPANAERRAQEIRDMNGGTIEEARAMSAKETSDLFSTVAVITDAQINEALSQSNGMKQLIEMSDSDPLLQKKAGPRLLRCVFKARIAAGKARTAPVAIAAKPAALSAAQIAECDTTIKTLQSSAPSWPGTGAQISASLGRQQKDLFTGKCAGHPQAAAYVAGAEKMIADGAKGAAAAPAATTAGPAIGAASAKPKQVASTTTTKVHNPANAANNCVKLVETGTKTEWGTEGRMKFVNQCAFTVAIGWCLTNGECQRNSGNLWSIETGKTWPVFFTEPGVQVRWGACRSKTGIEFTKGTQGQQYICP